MRIVGFEAEGGLRLGVVQPIGRMTLNRCPANFFDEVEQVAFHTGHLVAGIEVTDDPLMQAANRVVVDSHSWPRISWIAFRSIPRAYSDDAQ